MIENININKVVNAHTYFMNKVKIAISVDKPLLDIIDSKVDGSIIRSRSQAIEFFLNRGLQEQSIDTAVLLLKGTQQHIAFKEIKNKSLIKSQIDFFYKNGIKNICIVTQHTKNINKLLGEISDSKVNIKIFEKEAKGNAAALNAIKDYLAGRAFIAMSGDTYNDFDLKNMVKKHLQSNKMATMGLMSRQQTSEYGNAVLDGDLVVEFDEKPKKTKSNVVNAGIYVFSFEIFHLLNNSASLEKDLFPKLAKIKQLVGYFTHGEYMHLG